MSTKSPSKNSSKKRSLRNALRAILFKGRRQTPEETANTIGSGILRREPSLCTLTTQQSIQSIPTFAGRFDVEDQTYVPDRFCLSSTNDRFDVSSLASAVSTGQSLKPQLSLSSFKGHHLAYDDQSALYRQSLPHYHPRAEYGSTFYGDGFSHYGSVAALSPRPSTCWDTSSQYSGMVDSSRIVTSLTNRLSRSSSLATLPRMSSSLRIQTSVQSLRPESPTPTPPPRPPAGFCRPGLMRRGSSLSGIRQQTQSVDQQPIRNKPVSSSVRFADLPSPSRTPSLKSDSSRDHQINNFSSFCILDTSREECPVSATSKDLRYIFDIGEEFCLNNRGCEGSSMDMVTGCDAAGNPVTHLVLFSPLVIPSSGRSRFMLASLVDVTDFINDTASLPELETISEESFEDDLPTPTYKSQMHSTLRAPIQGIHYTLSAEDLLGGCFVAEPVIPVNLIDRCEDDIWLNIATEERLRSPGTTTPSNTSVSISSSIDDVLDEFMNGLQELYSDFFLLAKSPFDDNYYEICNVSPQVYASRDYVQGHLSRTSTGDMIELSTRLAYDEPFTILVRWGDQGVLKQMYCIPLFARASTTWVCFLIDSSMPLLW